jgi:hypothetical protein
VCFADTSVAEQERGPPTTRTRFIEQPAQPIEFLVAADECSHGSIQSAAIGGAASYGSGQGCRDNHCRKKRWRSPVLA